MEENHLFRLEDRDVEIAQQALDALLLVSPKFPSSLQSPFLAPETIYRPW